MTIKSIVTKSLICSAVALATVASASANYGFAYRAAWNEIQDRYCLQGMDWGYLGSCHNLRAWPVRQVQLPTAVSIRHMDITPAGMDTKLWRSAPFSSATAASRS